MPFYSPLRYPGGKRRLAGFTQRLFEQNGLSGGHYVEPFAGGAGLALAMLFSGHASNVHINDLDEGVHAFWHTVLYETDEMCRLVNDCAVTIETRERQVAAYRSASASLLERGFATLFLNRTSRSGIILGGVIGGKKQAGNWSIASRFGKPDLIRRIQAIGARRESIHLYVGEARTFMQEVFPTLPSQRLTFLDPPYYIKGGRKLYTSFYAAQDHGALQQLLRSMADHWIVSYDDVPEIRELYAEYRGMSYSMHYSAQSRYLGKELMFFSPALVVPEVTSPVRMAERRVTQCAS